MDGEQKWPQLRHPTGEQKINFTKKPALNLERVFYLKGFLLPHHKYGIAKKKFSVFPERTE